MGVALGHIGWMGSGEMRPDPEALARYQRAFPRRYVVWHTPRQLFEIRERDPLGRDSRVGFCELELSDDGVRRFQPFDHRFVTRRLIEFMEYQELGREEYHRRRMNRNRARGVAVLQRVQDEKDYMARHDRRFLAEIAENDRVSRLDPRPVHRRRTLPAMAPSRAKSFRSPLVAVGVSLT